MTLFSTISSTDGSIDTTISSVSETGQAMSANDVSVLERCLRTRPSGEPKSVPFSLLTNAWTHAAAADDPRVEQVGFPLACPISLNCRPGLDGTRRIRRCRLGTLTMEQKSISLQRLVLLLWRHLLMISRAWEGACRDRPHTTIFCKQMLPSQY